MLDRDDVIVIGMATTGTTENSEIVEITIMNTKGEVLLDQPVLPRGPIRKVASDVHGLTRAKLRELDAVTWDRVYPQVRSILQGAKVAAMYSYEYCLCMMEQSNRKWELQFGHRFKFPPVYCVMRSYTRYRGDHSAYGGYKWHKRVEAYERETGRQSNGTGRAKSICLETLSIMRAIVPRIDELRADDKRIRAEQAEQRRLRRERERAEWERRQREEPDDSASTGCLGMVIAVGVLPLFVVLAYLLS